MKPGARKKAFIALGIAIVGVSVWYFGFKESGESINSRTERLAVDSLANELSEPETVFRPPEPNKENTKTIDEFLGADLKEQFDEVAAAYEYTARYPANSQVVRDQELVAPKKPFEESEVTLKFPDIDGNELPVSLSAATDKFQYFNGDKIAARLQVIGAEENASIRASAVIVSPAGVELSQEKTLSFYTGGNNEFRTEFDSQVFSQDDIASEMLVRFTVDINDQNLAATVPFKYATASARLDSIPYSRVEGEFLDIPLQFTVFESGYYFVDAILDDANSSRPLVQLQAEGRMSNGNDVLILRAHQQALKDAGSQGPYSVRVRSAFRGANSNEIADTPVSLPIIPFGIPGVPFSEYDDVQYSDSEVQQRIEFLRGLGNQN